MRTVDLSMVLSPDMAVYPGDPRMDAQRFLTWQECGFNVLSLSMGTHTGTHVDVPLHALEHGLDTADMPLDRFCGQAMVLDASIADGRVSLPPSITDTIAKDTIVLLCTGWQTKAGSSAYFEHYPSLDPSLAEALAVRGVRMAGVDLPSVDNADTQGSIHHRLLEAGIPIAEGLVHLDALPRGELFFFSAVPLAIHGGDGSPVRAYAVIK